MWILYKNVYEVSCILLLLLLKFVSIFFFFFFAPLKVYEHVRMSLNIICVFYGTWQAYKSFATADLGDTKIN